MSSAGSQASKVWNGWRTIKIFEKEPGSLLPEAYRKFWTEWKILSPTAVHYVPKEGNWERNELSGVASPVQNISIPLKYPPQHNEGLWGGEAVIKGFQKRTSFKRRVPHFWVPVLKRSVVYSEVLNKHMSVIVTERLIKLVHENYGFDHYLLKTPACELKGLLALRLKRKVLQEISNKCPTYAATPEKQEQIYNRYKEYLTSYSPEEIEWYGYTFREACVKFQKQQEDLNKPQPLKNKYRLELIEKLRAGGIKEAGVMIDSQQTTEASWLQKINIFGKKHET